ncbi:MAG TPA: DUF3710 domain-containing protein [Micromonosporaceae bacterium]
MIFSRRRGTGAQRDEYGPDLEDLAESRAIPVPEVGPYDVEVAPEDGVPRIDLGALKIPNLPGNAIQLETGPDSQIVRVHLEREGSRLQLAAYAAPRSEGIWDEVRADLRTALLGGGAKVVEVAGEYGPALAARMPSGAGVGAVEVRHIGIDGPRWFVHAALIGPAAADPDSAGALHDVLHGLVVDRGSEARPVKEVLPLLLPPEFQAQVSEAIAAQAAATAQAAAATEHAAAKPAATQTAAAEAAAATRRSTGPRRARGRA